MSIYKTSRYAYSKLDYVQTALTSYPKPIVFYKIGYSSTFTYYEHVYIEGERLDQISSKYYNVPTLWWYIAQNNPGITNFNMILPGTVLKIPHV
jgi:hypothetical protein